MRYRLIAFLSVALSVLALSGPVSAQEPPKNDVKGLFLLTDYPAVTVRPGTTTTVNLATEVALPALQRERVATEKILGINNLKQISWIERGLEVSRSVCRILTPNGLGTGFLVDMRIDAEHVHVSGDIPVLGALLGKTVENGVKQIVQQTFGKGQTA